MLFPGQKCCLRLYGIHQVTLANKDVACDCLHVGSEKLLAGFDD